jgi:DNA-binding LacI/PurR family transcriptional regulator
MAIGALRACSESGLRVPQDISIIGFDDIPESAFTIPALTTIRQPKLAMGCRGAEVLINLIERQLTTSRPTQPLAVQLVIRESTSVHSEST